MCLDDQILNTYVDGQLEEPWKSQVEEHLSYCVSCRKRCESLMELSNRVKDAALSESEIDTRKDRVMSVLEKNYLNKKKSSFKSKILKFTFPQFAFTTAAAFVIVFVGSFALGSNSRRSDIIPVPEIGYSVDINNITPVRTSDNSTTTRSLESYSLDEILKNLDARGYDVDIRLKSIQPVSFGTAEDETQVIEVVEVIEITPEEVIPEEVIPEEVPAEELPVEEAPVEEIPVEELPVEELPVEEIPVEEIPAEEVIVNE